MQQRRLRLGDILDDYCPRERRITNHAIVAMIEDQVKQTRCTTCDADHEYKQARIPAPRRKKDGVLPGEPADAGRPTAALSDIDMSDEDQMPAGGLGGDDAPVEAPPVSATAQTEANGDPDVDVDALPSGDDASDDDGPVHRRLIRATLPRPEGQAPERKIPEFTIRQPGGRGRGDFDANRPGGGQQRHGRGRRVMRGPNQPGPSTGQPPRFGGPHHGSPQGERQNGNRPGPPGGQRGGGRPGQGQPRGPRPPGRKRGR
jgi:hypothetical protein